ncbi:LysR family transcriptional regulator [Marinomonas algicola]|jgi:DNA-binding transcriptional LysR family regulator|uniref:LysR family transcriptional regulator n=1 Tax=Marinomonas algicola TaxID=2773454 RepID=UPI001747E3CB|nr:LysR family transcriptional regulator [Marinomonas algicola]
MLNNQHLMTFKTLVEFKSFTSAAKVLNLTQPAVTQHIQKLEKELNQQLVIRQGKGVLMTSAGERLYCYINKVFDEYQNFRCAWDKSSDSAKKVGSA